MLIDLHRSFSEYSSESSEVQDEDWGAFLGMRNGRHAWSDLHEKPLVVVLGEAGIGKTTEFKHEVARLTGGGKAAFFLPLNQLQDSDSWTLALIGCEDSYAAWAASTATGYFFLDAVDEARLRSHADFERALTLVQQALGPHLWRVRVAISTRITDWSAVSVRAAVDTRLAMPIQRAFGAKAAAERPLSLDEASSVSLPADDDAAKVEALVVTLDPLSNTEARRCAEAFELQDVELFWSAVEDGDYEFMATRPLDLQWMVGLWNQRKTLGTYRDLIEVNVSNRLQEFNDSYEVAGEVLSVDQLRAGAVALAAAAEFGSAAFFVLEPGAVPADNELAPHTILSDWDPTEVRRLLATAVFDEASFGRVKFHHRSIREYLAAHWVRRQLELGVPLLRLQGLFAASPYGTSVLIPSRRAALSWLATISVEAREWVVRDFPEVLFFEGDPQAWDGLSADKAFDNFVSGSKFGLQTKWVNSASEYMRVGRSLSDGKVAAALVDPSRPPQIRSLCFYLARYAKLADCASGAFDIYRNTTAQEWERRYALEVLEVVATPAHRSAVLVDLQTSVLGSNELIARALQAVEWRSLTVAQLSAIFDSTRSEAVYGGGPMTEALKSGLLPSADLPGATLLLSAVMASLPRPMPGKRFARFTDPDQPERAWLLDALPHCYERVLALLQPTSTAYPKVYLDAAERIEAQRDTGFTDRVEFSRLRKAIAQHPGLRWSLALAIAESDDIRHSTRRLTWGASCIVSFDVDDLPELTRCANDSTLPTFEQEVWFSVALEVVFKNKRHKSRADALRALGVQGETSKRGILVRAEYKLWRQGAAQTRHWGAEEKLRKAATERDLEAFKTSLTAHLPQIRTGTHFGGLQRLLQYSFSRSRTNDHSTIDFDALAASLGPQIAEAFEEGLRAYWPMSVPPNPSDVSNGQLPWSALVALAGVRLTLRSQAVITSLSATEVERAAQLAVWELNGPPTWLEPLTRTHSATVNVALTAWILAEAQSATTGNGVRGALEMALNCASDVRKELIAALVPLAVDGGIVRDDTHKAVIDALKEDGLLPLATLTALCQSKLDSSIGPTGALAEMTWLRVWMEVEAHSAWAWFVRHVQTFPGDVEPAVSSFAAAVGDLKWLMVPLDSPTADVLLGIHSMLSMYPPAASTPSEDSDSHFFGPPSKRLREGIVTAFLAARGPIGHKGLVSLLARHTDPTERNWMKGRVNEHASLDAELVAKRTAAELKAIGSPFQSEPRTEAHLYEQVLARLEELRKNLEEGPFSERDLFSPRIPEKFLQRWLAAKFRETQNRRFSVHREEEVDDDNMTDIQLSCPAGNVCIEIKPVDSTRSYSANSLTDTLRTQIVGQYLRGANSTRGILVLMQLDNKTWSIPGGATGQAFPALVSYLESQAQAIKTVSDGVNELTVFGIRCVV
ncbi:hypothetical protein [Ottowia thiooxydans]|uniref:ATP-binding protein n=1 Tax=Ottowia thiooxydans TaxID=219182 RepID=A0ABV2QDN4_9BURK